MDVCGADMQDLEVTFIGQGSVGQKVAGRPIGDLICHNMLQNVNEK